MCFSTTEPSRCDPRPAIDEDGAVRLLDSQVDPAAGRVPSALPGDLNLDQGFFGRASGPTCTCWSVEELAYTGVGDVRR